MEPILNRPAGHEHLALRRSACQAHGATSTEREGWWAEQGSNLRPQPCKGCALPAELSARALKISQLCEMQSS